MFELHLNPFTVFFGALLIGFIIIGVIHLFGGFNETPEQRDRRRRRESGDFDFDGDGGGDSGGGGDGGGGGGGGGD